MTIQPGKKYSYREVTETVDKAVKRYKESNGNQAKRLGRFVTYLLEKGLLDEFNAWEEEKKRVENQENQGA